MYIFQKDDAKFRAWAEELSALGVATAAIPGSPLKAPVFVIRMMLSGVGLDGYVFRYLNDYPSLVKTLLRAASEYLVVALVRARGGSVYWIVHNVDRESESHHPTLTRWRRQLVARHADCVFVTDPLLIPRAEESLPPVRKLAWVCFGRPLRTHDAPGTERVAEAVTCLRRDLGQRHPGKTIRIGLCVSAASPKCMHYLSAPAFVERAATASTVVGLVVVGPVQRIGLREFDAAAEAMRREDRIAFIDEAVPIDEEKIDAHVDFFYRALTDFSVSYTAYVAAGIARPLVVERGTFLADFVSRYSIGIVVPDWAGDGEDDWLEVGLSRWDPRRADEFLEIRSWRVAAENFRNAVAAS